MRMALRATNSVSRSFLGRLSYAAVKGNAALMSDGAACVAIHARLRADPDGIGLTHTEQLTEWRDAHSTVKDDDLRLASP